VFWGEAVCRRVADGVERPETQRSFDSRRRRSAKHLE
jgi:hypothetical protein